MTHDYDPDCNCDGCFTIWRAEAEVEKAAARLVGDEKRRVRNALWSAMIAHFGGASRQGDPA